MGKDEHASKQHLLLFPLCFRIFVSTLGMFLKTIDCLTKGYSVTRRQKFPLDHNHRKFHRQLIERDSNDIIRLERVENGARKGENAGNQNFHFSHNVCRSLLFPGH